jgi:hypothetical protein
MRHQSAVVLRKIRGVFGACWKGCAYFIGADRAGPAMATGRGMLGGSASSAPRSSGRSSRSRCSCSRSRSRRRTASRTPTAQSWRRPAAELINKLTAILLRVPLGERRAHQGARGRQGARSAPAREAGRREQLDHGAAGAAGRGARTDAAPRDRAGARHGRASDVRDADMKDAGRFFSLTRGKPVVNVTADDLKEYQAYKGVRAVSAKGRAGAGEPRRAPRSRLARRRMAGSGSRRIPRARSSSSSRISRACARSRA